MKKDEMVDKLMELGVEIPEGATKAELSDLLAANAPAEEESAEEVYECGNKCSRPDVVRHGATGLYCRECGWHKRKALPPRP